MKSINLKSDDVGVSAMLLTRDEVLRLANVRYPTLWRWMVAGKFPVGKTICGKVAWLRADIEKWISELPPQELKKKNSDTDTATASISKNSEPRKKVKRRAA